MLEALTTVCSSLTWIENNTTASIGPTRTYRLWSVDLCSDEDEEDLYIHPMPFILIVNIYQRTSDFEQDLNWVRTSINNFNFEIKVDFHHRALQYFDFLI